MTLRVCAFCTTRFAVGCPACPHCGSIDHHEEGEDPMAKITVHNGPSNAAADQPPGAPPGFSASWSDDERDAPGTGEPMEGIDAPADGTPAELPGDDDAQAEAPERPPLSAPKSAWVAYVAALTGEDEAAVNTRTRTDLIAEHGTDPD